MGDIYTFRRAIALGITLIAATIVVVCFAMYDWSHEPLHALTFRIIAGLAASFACIVSLVLIWKPQPSDFAIDLVLFLSLGALTYGLETTILSGWPGFENIKSLLVIVPGGLSAIMAFRFLLHFQTEFKVVGPFISEEKRYSELYKQLREYIEWPFLGRRLLYSSVAVILTGLLAEIFFETGIVVLIILLFLFVIYIPNRLWYIYRHTEEINKKRILWLVYGFYGALGVQGCVSIAIKILLGWPRSAQMEIGWASAFLVLVLSIAISFFATDLFNVHLVIRRTITYGSLSLLLVFLFAMLEEVLINFLGRYFTDLVQYDSIIMAGILAVAGSILRKGIEPLVNKYLKFSPSVKKPDSGVNL